MIPDISGLPGEELVARGISDLAAGTESAEALLVCIAYDRIRDAGLALPAPLAGSEDFELRLYRLLGTIDPDDAFGRYNSLLRRLVSFERALECRVSRLHSDPT